jgi:5-methylcytosine-specific restriction protein B
MSRYCGEKKTRGLFEAAEHWIQNALLKDKSVLGDDTLWTLENLQALDEYLIKQPDEGEGSFFDKLSTQLSPTSPEVKQLAAEIFWVMQLCPSNTGQTKKREGIETIWQWSEKPFPEDSHLLSDEVLAGVGSAGTGYNTNRWRELVFFIRTMIAFKQSDQDQRRGLLEDGWKFAKWLEQIPECDSRQFRHMILFLLFPDDFERIFGGTDRRAIVAAISGKTKAQVKQLSAFEIDKELSTTRKQQEKIFGTTELDYYKPPLRNLWKDEKKVVWLLSWNPNKWNWENFKEARSATHQGKTVTERWNCANHNASVGDTIYLVRTGEEPRGIIATGNVISSCYEDIHWDEKKASEGKTTSCIDVSFSRIQDSAANDPYITNEDLKKIDVDNQVWFPQASGIQIKQRSAGMLKKLWEAKVESVIKSEPKPPVQFSKDPTNLILYGPPGTGKTYQLNRLADRYRDKKLPKDSRDPNNHIRNEFVTFHQAYSYEDFVEGIRPVMDPQTGEVSYKVVEGVFQRIAGKAKLDPSQKYAIFIDEINRGNIAKIFGELITLIEPDKRIVCSENGERLSGMEVTLPYSGKKFGVPSNLDIYGTMNTADRSIALLDVALRRRFNFQELMPNPDFISGSNGDGYIEDDEGGDINLRELLRAINRRILFLLNRDMTLGHAYFINIRDFASLRDVLIKQIIPLLQEYFYEDWHRIQLVFRDVGPANEPLEPQIIFHEAMAEQDVLGFDHDDYEDHVIYRVAKREEITPEAIRKIYEEPA